MLASNDVLDVLRTAPRFEGSSIRSDDRYVYRPNTPDVGKICLSEI
jgi:hypothetical protein